MIDDTHDPARTSWIDSANGHADFPIQNLALGIFAPPGGGARVGVAIGDWILDLGGVAGLLPDEAARHLGGMTLNALLAAPKAVRLALRRKLSALLSDEAQRAMIAPLLHQTATATMHLPCAIGDYTDFYAGIHHAANVGSLFRPDAPLLPNYKYVPIGYHGRASSVRPSGTPVRRPSGQRKEADAEMPTFGATRRLDYEVELGVWIGPGSMLGEPIALDAAADHIAGLSLLNDWSARDLQAWEYQPLGPFLAKNFLTSISPWIVTAEALAPFRIAQPPRPAGDPAPLPHLWDERDQAQGGYAIELEAWLSTAAMRAAGSQPLRLSRTSADNLYWTVGQMVAHHTSNGCDLQAGDLLGTGTISGPDEGGRGSLLEISEGGKRPLALPSGETRCFLEDGDELTLTGRMRADGFVPIGFGPCRGIVSG